MIKKTFAPVFACLAAVVLAFSFSSCASTSCATKKACCTQKECPKCCSTGKCTAGQPQTCSK